MATQKTSIKPTPEAVAAFEEVRDLLKDVDLTTPEGAAYARQLLRERDLPEFLVYGAKRQPAQQSPEALAWAEQRIKELRERGDVP